MSGDVRSGARAGAPEQEAASGTTTRRTGRVDLHLATTIAAGVVLVAAAAVSLALPANEVGYVATAVLLALALLLTLVA